MSMTLVSFVTDIIRAKNSCFMYSFEPAYWLVWYCHYLRRVIQEKKLQMMKSALEVFSLQAPQWVFWIIVFWENYSGLHVYGGYSLCSLSKFVTELTLRLLVGIQFVRRNALYFRLVDFRYQQLQVTVQFSNLQCCKIHVLKKKITLLILQADDIITQQPTFHVVLILCP